MFRVICCVALLLMTAPLYSQGLSLEEAVEMAATGNYGLKAGDEGVNLRQKAVSELSARSKLKPATSRSRSAVARSCPGH